MTHVELLDETLRDGQQSLWGMRMQAGMALPVADALDRTGFHVIDATGSSFMEVLVKYCQEDPWAGLDLLRAAIYRTPMRAGMRGNACVSFGLTPPALMDLWMRRLCEHGVRSFWIYDVLYGIENFARLARIAKEYSSEVIGTVFFSESPVHTDEYLAAKAREIGAVAEIDGILFYDTAGVLQVERLRTLVPQIVAAAPGKQVEFHSNNLMGMSGLAYVEAASLGMRVLHTAARSMANGPSVPSTESVVRNLEMLGISHSIDTSLLAPVAEHFRRVGRAAGYPVDAVSEYDLFNVIHQVPGGMVGTLRAQLDQHGMPERIEEVLTETGAVRRELGWPVMATPLSQLVGTQAVLNIVTGERYSVVPDEVVAYALGRYGASPAPIEPDVLDRIMSGRRAAEIAAAPADDPTLEELRARYGTGTDDDSLILKALIPEADISAMRAAGPPRRDYPFVSSEVDEIRALIKTARSPYVRILNERFDLELRR
ncbi:MAG: pyruvate carboxylase [Solirubrobacteraceae bacterium]